MSGAACFSKSLSSREAAAKIPLLEDNGKERVDVIGENQQVLCMIVCGVECGKKSYPT
jgi:hypothetical protein